MAQDNILLDKKGYVSIITIDHPPANAWNLTTAQEFESALDKVENDPDTRVVVITGAGEKCFSAGFDVSDAANVGETNPLVCSLWTRVDRFPKPTIAAINGFALGGGCELAMSCHFRIMADHPKAKIGLTELNLGLIPGWGGTQRMARLIGKAKALDLILFSQKVTAPEAKEIGLVNQVSTPERLMDDALELAKRLAERPPIAVSCILKAMATGAYEGIDAGLQVEFDSAQTLSQTEDAKEGLTAFFEKRPPVFTGK
ncbi:MAG: enoyl-CoA hydratase [Proteobacteria bacterium]|nr:enoyl-CoA hydratase [Pseudomonadota bacterium]